MVYIMLSRIEFLITETFLSLRRHPGMAFAAIVCVASALFASGLVGLTILNADNLVNNAKSRVRFCVFFRTDLSRADALATTERIKRMSGVESVKFVTKEEGWEKQQQKLTDVARMVKDKTISGNPLPDSIEVKAVDITLITSIENKLHSWREIDSTLNYPDVSTFLENAGRGVRLFGSILGLVLGLISLVIIHHTIELTLYARRKEIQIMSLVGATPATVAMPFLLEGIVYGLIGGSIAVGGLYLLYNYLTTLLLKYSAQLMEITPILSHGIMIMLGLGAVLGLLGSLASVVKYLHRPRSRVTNA